MACAANQLPDLRHPDLLQPRFRSDPNPVGCSQRASRQLECHFPGSVSRHCIIMANPRDLEAEISCWSCSKWENFTGSVSMCSHTHRTDRADLFFFSSFAVTSTTTTPATEAAHPTLVGTMPVSISAKTLVPIRSCLNAPPIDRARDFSSTISASSRSRSSHRKPFVSTSSRMSTLL